VITDWALGLVSSLIEWLLSVLPQWSFHLPGGFMDFIAGMKSYDDYFPISEVLTCLALTVSLFSAMLTYKLVVKIIDWVTAVIP